MFINRLLCGFSATLRGTCRSRVLAGGGQRAMSIYPINDDIFGLNEDERQLRETVFNFVQKEVAPHAQEIDKTNDFKDIRKLWRKIGDLGFHGIVAPGDYGGTDGSYLDHCIIMEEFSRAAGGIALSYSAHSNLCVNLLNRNANDKQKEKYLPKLCSGEFIGGAAMSETEAGSDVLAMKTTAEKKGDYFVLNGRKCFATNGPIADVLVIYAKTDTTVESKRGITGFIVDTKSEGFKSGPNYEKLGMAGSATNAISFENLKVPAENVISGVNQGVYVLMSGLDHERLVLAAGPIGLMQAAIDVSFDYAHQRKQMNQRIGQFQLIQGKMADMYTTLNACRSYLYNTARASCQGRATTKDCAGVLLYCGEKATQITLDAIQILGGNGYINEYPTGRFLRDAKCYTVAGGTSEIRRWVIGRAINAEYGGR